MFNYILRRILLFIPTMLIISMLVFALSKLAPGDPVTKLLGFEFNIDSPTTDPLEVERIYQKKSQQLGLDKPFFYITLRAWAYPDTLHRITNKYKRNAQEKITSQYGNWDTTSSYFSKLEGFLSLLRANTKDSILYKIVNQTDDLLYLSDTKKIEKSLGSIATSLTDTLGTNSIVIDKFKDLKTSFNRIENESTIYQLYLPKISYYGLDNQYHNWLVATLSGDFGYSYQDKIPSSEKIKKAFIVTLKMSGISLLLAFLISIPLGVYLAKHNGSKRQQWITTFLFSLYALPNFWIATILIIFFTTNTYGDFLDLFPTYGIGGNLPEGTPYIYLIGDKIHHYILPVLCLTYPILAYLTKHMQAALLEIMDSEYIKTAKAKGLHQNKIIWKHAFKNALFPMITILGVIIPSALGGSVAIEYIFNIPGMGRLIFNSIIVQDWPVVFSIVWVFSFLSLIVNLLVDIIYVWIDPRVNFKTSEY